MEILPFSDKHIMQKNIPWMQAKKICLINQGEANNRYEEWNELGDCLIS